MFSLETKKTLSPPATAVGDNYNNKNNLGLKPSLPAYPQRYNQHCRAGFTPKQGFNQQTFKNTALLALSIILTVLFFSCSSSEKKSERLEKLYSMLRFASQTKLELQKNILNPNPPSDSDSGDFLDLVSLFQQGELETVANALDEIIAEQTSDEGIAQYDDENSPIVGKRLEALKSAEAIDFFSTLQTLDFFYSHFYRSDKSLRKEPASSG